MMSEEDEEMMPGEADAGGEEASEVRDYGVVMEKGELKIRLGTVKKDNENGGGKKRQRRYSPCYKPPPDRDDIF